MTVHSLQPSYVVLNYHSDFGAHKQIIPTTQWSPGEPGEPSGSFLSWNENARVAADMITELVEDLLPAYPDDVAYDSYEIWTFEGSPLRAVPVYQAAFTGMVGSSGTPGWTKAVELVMTFHTTLFNIFKITLLDAASANNFDKLTALGTLTAVQPIIDDVTDPDNGWAGRDSARPSVFLQLSKNLNEKLRAEYRMN